LVLAHNELSVALHSYGLRTVDEPGLRLALHPPAPLPSPQPAHVPSLRVTGPWPWWDACELWL
jgi:hypothetical protein